GDDGRIILRGSVAFLLPLFSDKGRPMGVLTALCSRDVASMPYKRCKSLLEPALRSLSRELSLRMHLLETTTRLNIQDGEQDFLKMLGDKARTSSGCEKTLREIIELTVGHLLQDGAVLLDPQHDFCISVGINPPDISEAETILNSVQELISNNPMNVSDALANLPTPSPHDRNRFWPILEEDKRVIGVLVMKRPARKLKLSDHSNILMNFVISTIEHVLEKGFDKLTGLNNLSGFETALERACASGRPENFSLMYIDLDQLQVINDTFGRGTGDLVLKGLADIIRSVIPGQHITRVTSDSFAALLDGLEIKETQRLGKEIIKKLGEFDYSAGPRGFKLSASIGVAPMLPNEDSVRSALVPAQIACQAAKGRGRGRCEMYVSSDESIVQRMDDLNLVGSIQAAIEGGRLVLFSQPIIPTSGEVDVSHHEVLVRMQDSHGGTIEPGDFMGAAERYQLMQDLDRWVVSRSFDLLQEFDTGPDGKPLHFHINLSGQSLGNSQFLDYVRAELKRTALSPERIGFEITETVAVKNLQKAQVFIHELKQMGCKFSLDDFGTGLSSFAYLKLFPVDRLKVDGSFIRDLSTNQISRSMVGAIVEIAKVMQIETVAEYVETAETFAAIGELGLDWAQGYYIDRPKKLRELLGGDSATDTTKLADFESRAITDVT
ncbi:MAG: putative bifunctional diguanylate cyclase/phosphodiesterase, partial [Gammaproteobacteria bacterium]